MTIFKNNFIYTFSLLDIIAYTLICLQRHCLCTLIYYLIKVAYTFDRPIKHI